MSDAQVHNKKISWRFQSDSQLKNTLAAAVYHICPQTDSIVRFNQTKKKADSKIYLFDIRGKRLRTWRLNGLTSGSVRWDGKDQYGLDLMSGLYFVAFQTELTLFYRAHRY